MKFKQIILIIIIVVVLILAGVFFYKSVAGSKTASIAEPTATATSGGSSADDGNTILPHGDNLDFTQVKKFNSTGQIFQYPTATPDQVGSQLNDIISQ